MMETLASRKNCVFGAGSSGWSHSSSRSYVVCSKRLEGFSAAPRPRMDCPVFIITTVARKVCLSKSGGLDLDGIHFPRACAYRDRHRTAAYLAVDNKLRTTFARVKRNLEIFPAMRTSDCQEITHYTDCSLPELSKVVRFDGSFPWSKEEKSIVQRFQESEQHYR